MAHMRFYQSSSWLVLGTIAYLFFMHLDSLNGQLLSDSFSLIYNCYSWQQTNQMGHALLSFLHRSVSETAGSYMFRPLAIASLCTDYMLWGEQAFAHKFIQMLWHMGNGVLLYVLLVKVCRHYQLDARFAAVTACLFLLSHLTPEISVWVAGRFDALVQTFMFLCLYAFWAQKRLWALFFLGLALLSKESAMVLVPMLISLSCLRHWGKAGGFKTIGRETGFFIILLGFYLIYRWYIFGQSTQVYPQVGSIFDRIILHASTFPTFLWRTVFVAVDQVIVSWVYLILMLGLFGYSFYQARQHKILRLWLFLTSGMAVVLLALMTQMGSGEVSGTGARLLYIVIPWQMALVSLPLLFQTGRIYQAVMTGFLLLTIWMHCVVIQQWTNASQISKIMVNKIPEMAQSVDQDNWSLLLAPDHIGAGLLARNAQGAIVSPPYQKQLFIDSVVPFVWGDLNLWRVRSNSQFVEQFKTNSSQPNAYPQFAYCLSKNGDLIREKISRNVFKSKSEWYLFWQTLVDQNNCYQ